MQRGAAEIQLQLRMRIDIVQCPRDWPEDLNHALGGALAAEIRDSWHIQVQP